jgi:K+/H+ antiporter YhaU regulatory subunit KhtT
MAGETIGALGLRKNWGVTVVALRRNGEWIANPGPETALKAGDVMVLFGRTCDIQKIHSLMRASEASA